MSLMSKLLTSTLIATIALSANVEKPNTIPSNEQLLQYIKKDIVKNPQVNVKGIEVIETKTDKALPGWNILLTNMDIEYQGKDVKVPETIFVKDGLATGHLVNLKDGHDYREDIKPTVPDSMYNDAHLLYGNKDAAHKVLLFSDPMCPFCREVVPDILKAAKEHPDKIALYYYHLPLLRIHPVSGILTRVMHQAQAEGKKDVVDKMYSLKVDPRNTDMTKVLAKVKEHTGYSTTADKLDGKAEKDAIKNDADAAARLMVGGTPTVYIDGEWDKKRDGYKKLVK